MHILIANCSIELYFGYLCREFPSQFCCVPSLCSRGIGLRCFLCLVILEDKKRETLVDKIFGGSLEMRSHCEQCGDVCWQVLC